MSRESINAVAPPAKDDDIDFVILQAVRSIRYGSIEIVVHNAKVVQIERREKLRFVPNGS